MGHGDCCNEFKCKKFKTKCGGCGKMKIEQPKPQGFNRNVAAQAVTLTTTTVMTLTTGAFSFNNIGNNSCCCKSRCSPCGGCYNNQNINNNSNVVCLSCEGIYNVTTFVTFDTAPGANSVVVALDVNGQQVMAYPLTGNGQALSFSTNLNLCATDRIQWRLYGTGSYTGNTTGGNVSVVRVSGRIGCR